MSEKLKYRFPLDKQAVISDDSNSFVGIDYQYQTEVLVGNHVGAFGTVRKNHVHEGVDLYCLPGDEVYAMEDGVVTLVEHFTGEFTSPPSPWWENTRAVHVEGETGVIVYGELIEEDSIVEGKAVKRGELIGKVKTVLRKDKGRPMTMLHLELYDHGSRASVVWDVGAEKPALLKDPTDILIAAMGNLPKVTVNCMECDGRGFIGGHLDACGDVDNLNVFWKDPETCPSCKGTKTEAIDIIQAKMMGEKIISIHSI